MLPSTFGLLPYQAAFAANPSRFKIGLWARQTGKDHTATFEAVVDSIRNPGTLWIIVAAGERQALESLAKAKEWAAKLKLRIEHYSEEKPNPAARMQSAEIRWSNGSRLLALPANPQTIRGYSANLILTEFAFHENPDAIWRAIYPSISNPLRGGLKKLRIISTPNGLNNKFAQLWHNTPNPYSSAALSLAGQPSTSPATPGLTLPALPEERDSLIEVPPRNPSLLAHPKLRPSTTAYHKSKITIHDAIASGLPLDAGELQAGLNDDDAWSQEYLCEFTDSATVMFPYDLIAPCESADASESFNLLENSRSAFLYAGLDFGRKHHLTVCWIIERVPNPHWNSVSEPRSRYLFITREVLCLKNTSTPEQFQILRPLLRLCHKVAFDYTGPGIGLGDQLVQEFGGGLSTSGPGLPRGHAGKIELCQFTPAFKAELFPRLRAAFEQRSLRIPIHREIREDLHGIQRIVSLAGQISYRASSSADGHSDRATALALAWRAASSAPISSGSSVVEIPRTGSHRYFRSIFAYD